jgi:hypothetical protein
VRGSATRPGEPGDVCVLLAASRPLTPDVHARLNQLQRVYGGRIVDPLHLTLDRVSGDRTDDLIAAVRRSVPDLRPVVVRGEGLMTMRSSYRGGDILKIEATQEHVAPDVDAVRSAVRAAGLRSLYGDERRANVTVLEGITRAGHVAGDHWQPLDLFTADLVIVSRIAGASSYDILDRISLPAETG